MPVVWIGSQHLTCPLNKYLLFGKNICSKALSYQQDWGVLKPQSGPETSRSEALSAQTLGCDWTLGLRGPGHGEGRAA